MLASACRRWAAVAALTLPLTLTACNPFADGPGGAREAAAEGESWIVVTKGEAEPEPVPPAPAQRPEPDADELHLPEREPVAEAPVHREACAQAATGTGAIAGLTVDPGADAATVTWHHAGDRGVLSYRLAAVPQNFVTGQQAPLRWQTIPAAEGCRAMTATVGGLDRGAPYIFGLDAVRTSPGLDGARTHTVARSAVVRTG